MSQSLPSNFYPNKIMGEDLKTFYNQEKTEIKTFMLDKNGRPMDSNVSFF